MSAYRTALKKKIGDNDADERGGPMDGDRDDMGMRFGTGMAHKPKYEYEKLTKVGKRPMPKFGKKKGLRLPS